MLEPRVARLEADVAELKADVKTIDGRVMALATQVAALPTRSELRNWNLAMLGIVTAAVIAMGSLTVAAMANQLSAFQAGLSAIQAVAQRDSPQPIIIQLPPPAPAPVAPRP